MPPPWLLLGALEQPVGWGGIGWPVVFQQECFCGDEMEPTQPRVCPQSDAPGQGLHVGEGEASRLSAGGQASPGPQWTGSHPPQEEVVCAVISAHSLTAATAPTAEPEVLIAVTATDNQHFRPGGGGASVPR